MANKFVLTDQLDRFYENCKKVFALKGEGGSAVNALTYKGSVATYAELPTDNTVGDVWNIQTADKTHGIKAGENVVWNGTAWDNLGGTCDMSEYAKEADQQKDIVSASVADAKITLTARDGTATELTVDNVENANQARYDNEGNRITESYIRTKVAVTNVSGSDDTINVSYVSQMNGVYSNSTSDITINNVAHATKATQDGDGNVIKDTYVKAADIHVITDAEIDALFD